MWSALSKDFMSFAKNVKEESHGFMGVLSRFAADVVGEDGVYAGDEASQEAVDMPLDVDTLVKFQEDRRTYTEPLSTLEHTVFSDWAASSPFSSLHADARHARRVANDPNSPSSKAAAQGWTNEPEDEVRQRLLDYSEAVLNKYVELVGEAVSPRASLARKPDFPNSPQSPQAPQASGAAADATPNAATTTTAAAAAAGTSPAPATPTPVRAPGSPSAALLSEDDFFDRYFFRLAQLRCQVAEQRREREEAAEKQRRAQQEQQQQQRDAAAATRSRGGDAAAPPSLPPPGADEDEQGRDEHDVAVPLFAKKVLSAASGFMNAVDSALIGPTDGRDPDGSDDDNVAPAMLKAGSQGRTDMHALGKATSRAALQEQVVGLESVVQELQDQLRRESARTQQLEAVLTSHGLAVPDWPVITPSKPQSPLVVVTAPLATTADATPTATSQATAGASSAASTPAQAPQPPIAPLSAPRPAPTPATHVDATPTSAHASAAVAASAMPLTPPAFKPFVSTPNASATSPAASASVGATPVAAAAAAAGPPSMPMFSASATPKDSSAQRPTPSTGASPLSSKKTD